MDRPTLSDILYAGDIESMGSFKELKQCLRDAIPENLALYDVRGWDDLRALRKDLNSLAQKMNNKSKNVNGSTGEKSDSTEDDQFFVSQAAKLVFFLTELDGKSRLEKIGYEKKMSYDKEEAKNWRNKIIKKIHPDYCNHPRAKEATEELDKMYKEITAR